MEKQKREFPFQIHIAIGVIWIVIGAAVMSGVASLLWILTGVLFITIGLLAMRKKIKKTN
ncbi:MAG: hypothetical protein ISS83_00140 [Candidatus Pacebacteria bacterium]|nr:hypothetical protein [Candidatus Paceibacterota bacterium]